jgi:ribose-phosphate pyrophosphokinase
MVIEVLESLLGRQRSLSKDTKVKIFSGTSNPALAQEISSYLRLPVSELKIKHFSDGEIFIRVQETVRGYDVFVVQPTSSPVNESIMELLIIVDALKRASAKSINVVIPYYGYARQDRKAQGREAITSKLVADLISKAGVDRVITMDLHAGQIQGFFDIKVDHLHALPVFVEYFKNMDLHDPVIVSPDVGGVARTRLLANKLNDAPIAIIDKRRPDHNKVEVYNLIGDVNDRDVIVIDDMIDTFGTLQAAGDMLKEKGARRIFACATHAVFSGPAYERINNSVFDEIIVTNTIDADRHPLDSDKIKCLGVASLLGEAIYRICEDESVSELF